MKQTASFISAYAADTSGVCSALYELGGLVIMHDASGCNSTYHTHDEPRAYSMDSAVYVSALTEMEAIMGGDERLVNDIVQAAEELQPKFIAVCGSPIPMITGVDFAALAQMCEQRTGITSFGFATNGMHSYLSGISQAYQGLAKRIVKPKESTIPRAVNILGATPLDFSLNGQIEDIKAFLVSHGFSVNSCWSMQSSLEEIAASARAQVNLVISSAALATAKLLERNYGIPYVAGVPYGEGFAQQLAQELEQACQSGRSVVAYQNGRADKAETLIIGESVTSCSLAAALAADLGFNTKVVCPLETSRELLRSADVRVSAEDELLPYLKDASIVIADGLYAPLVPASAKFYNLPHDGFSGRMYHDILPNLINKPFTKENHHA